MTDIHHTESEKATERERQKLVKRETKRGRGTEQKIDKHRETEKMG